MTKAVDRPEKELKFLIEFWWGNPVQRVKWTNWAVNIGDFLPQPAIEVDLPKNNGTLSVEICTIKTSIQPWNTAFLEPLTRGTPFPPTRCVITERVDPSIPGDEATQQIVFKGHVHRTRKNADGRQGFVQIQLVGVTSEFDVKLGFPANHHCPWRVFGPGCSKQANDGSQFGPQQGIEQKAAILSVIDGKEVTFNIQDISLDPGKTYTRGFLLFNDTRIGIKYYDTSQTGLGQTLLLTEAPPTEWLSKVITLVPGCTKQIDGEGGCRIGWANEEQFGGSGFAIPAYNPLIENPQ